MAASKLQLCVSPLTDKISTTLPRFYLRFRSPPHHWYLWEYYATKLEVGKPKMAAYKIFKCMYHRFQTRYQQNSNDFTYVFGFSISLVLVRILCHQTGSEKHMIFCKCETEWPVFWQWHLYDNLSFDQQARLYICVFEVQRSPPGLFLLPVWSHGIPTSFQNIGVMVVANANSYKSCLREELFAFEVQRPSSWIIHLRFDCTVFSSVPLDYRTPKV